MAEERRIVLGAGSVPAEDDLRLPRPPGVIRRFWTRHPLLADILIAVLSLLLTVPALVFRAPAADPVSGWLIVAGAVISVGACVALVWRRRHPIVVYVVSLLPAAVADPSLAGAVTTPAAVIALYSVAVYAGAKACWIAYGATGGVLAVQALARILSGASTLGAQLNVDISTMVLLLLGALIGVNVGNRRRYLNALIERSRQLLRERDQQAQLATAAERNRIAREMHDIVSHSLTVVVALADGASATTDPRRAGEATRAIAETARTALAEMRVMLGVLRDDAEAPLEPLGQTSVQEVVAGARATGAPVTFSVTGAADQTPAVRLATLRIVTEGLTNALRYARDPSRIHVRIVHEGAGVDVTIENDGSEADSPSQGAGLGLTGLRERVAHVGGTMDAGIASPGVWRLHARIPDRRPDA